MADEEQEEMSQFDRANAGPTGEHSPKTGSDVEELDQIAEDFDFSGVEAPANDVERLDANRALRIFAKRLPTSQAFNQILARAGSELGRPERGNSRFLAAELQRKLLSMIPEDLWTEDFLNTVDVRPMLQDVLAGPYIDGDPNQRSTVRGVEMTRQERAIAGIMLTSEQKKIENRLIEEYTATVPEGDVAALEMAVTTATNEANSWRTASSIGSTPIPPEGQVFRDLNNPNEFSSTAGGNSELAAFEEMLNGGGENNMTETKFMNARNVQLLFQSGELDLDTLNFMETESSGVMIDGAPMTTKARIEYESRPDNDPRMQTTADGRPLYTGGAEEQDRGQYQGKDWYSVREILRKPNQMSPEELQALSDKLEKAGIFDLVGADPTIPGDAQDPAFKAAWKFLASMSLEKGVPMTEILAERTTAYQTELNAALSTRLTDPARLKLNADAYAYDSLGRKLTEEEHLQLTEFVHNLERRNARTEAGLDINAGDMDAIEGIEGLDEGIVADVDAQMQQYIRDENPAEAGASDIADTYDMFTRMISGPGRGVS